MSYEAMTWAAKVLEECDWPTPMRFVFLIMANRADEEGELYPSVRWIMKRTGLAESTVREATKQIQKSGYLGKAQQKRDDGGQSSNRYKLPMDQHVLTLVHPGPLDGGGLLGGVPGGASHGGGAVHTVEGPGPSHGVHKTKEEKKESSKPLCPLSADRFEEAMRELPKRAGNNSRHNAVKAWNARIRSGVSPDAIVAGAVRYRAFCEATGKVGTETVQMAATFFGAALPFEQDWALPVSPAKASAPAPDWWTTREGVLAKAKENGLEPAAEGFGTDARSAERFFIFKCQLFAILGDGSWRNYRDVTEERIVNAWRERNAAAESA